MASKSSSAKSAAELDPDSQELQEPAAGDPAADSESGSLEEPSEPLSPEQQIQADLEMWKDLALRRQADFDNYRKRVAREKAETSAYANASLLEQLLPVIDSFEMGLAAARAESTDSIIFQGMSMVQRQLASFLENQQVNVIDADPAAPPAFDPAVHEAVGQEPSDEVADGHVIRVQRRGYRLRDRLLRPALVLVSSGPADAAKDTAN